MLKDLLHSRSEKVQPLTKEDTRLSTFSRSKYKHQQTLWRLSVSPTVHESLHDSYNRRLRRKRVSRRTLLRVALLNAGLSALASVLGYVALRPVAMERESVGGLGIWLKAGIGTIAMVQVSLLLLYHSTVQRYEGLQRHSLRMQRSLYRDWKSLCLLEYCLHLLVLVPEAQSIAVPGTGLALNDCLYVGLLLRNYDLVRVGYWLWGLDAIRIEFYEGLMAAGTVFLWKLWLHGLSIPMAVCTYLLTLGFMGVMWDVIRRAENYVGENSSYNDITTVAFSQALLGFGPEAPGSFLCQFTLLLCCFLGICILVCLISHSIKTLALDKGQEELYIALIQGYDLVSYRQEAICLLQSWWRKQQAKRRKLWTGLEFTNYKRRLVSFRAIRAGNLKDKGESLRMQLRAVSVAVRGKLVDLKKEVKDLEPTRRLSMKLSLLLLRSQRHIAIQARLLVFPRLMLGRRPKKEQSLRQLSTIPEESEVLETASAAARRLSADSSACSRPQVADCGW